MGVDIAEIGRFERLVLRGADRMWTHWYTEVEAEECARHRRPGLAAALRFAVKEATYKALGARFPGAVRWRDIEVLGRESAAWRLELHGGIAAVAAAAGVDDYHVSTCQTGGRIMAVVIAEGNSPTFQPATTPRAYAYAASQTTNRGHG